MEYLTVKVYKTKSNYMTTNDYIYKTLLDDIFIPKRTEIIHYGTYNLITYLLDIKALFRFVDPTKLTLRIKYGRKYYTYEEFKDMMEPECPHDYKKFRDILEQGDTH